jgi:hypothetical protein
VSATIEHVITTDMETGRPLPPLIENGIIWRVVRRLPNGRTLWRRIALQTDTSSSTAAARRRDLFLGGNENSP